MAQQKCHARWVDQVLTFWFDELTPADWFRTNSAVDEAIAQRFSDLHNELIGAPLQACLCTSNAMLASIIVLDQFSRNLNRNSPQAFANDAQAMAIANEALIRKLDRELPKERRVFVYLPFEHSENLEDQNRSVELVTALGSDGYTKYAHAHRDVIAQFGRFPHRNAVLGRPSTPAEQAYLANPGSGF